MRRTKHVGTVATAIVALTAVVAVGIGPTVLAQEIDPLEEAQALLANELNTIDVIERFGSSVVAVNVEVRGEAVPPRRSLPDEENQRFEQFFGDEARVQRSNGSGFLIEFEDEPFLVTNFHVVEGALEPDTADYLEGAEISVNFPADADQDVVVDVVGVNPSFDLALLQLRDESELPAAPPLAIADSDGLSVGQKTIAIGNPFGLASSVTSGIVSALGRFVPTIGQLPVPMVQTDAAINPGNSGGPLLDSRGRLIGINTALINPQGRSFAGLGFAVPSNLLTESLANLELGGVTDVSSTRPRLGIAAQSLAFIPAGIRAELGLPDEGVTIIEVLAGSVADRAGLIGSTDTIRLDEDFEVPAPGDTIVAIDGEPIDSVEDITMKVTYESQGGDQLDFTVLRGGVEISVAVTLEVSAANTLAVAP
jgi:S1-C subfamily serine protease